MRMKNFLESINLEILYFHDIQIINLYPIKEILRTET